MDLEWGNEQSGGEVDEIENEKDGEDENSLNDSAPNLLDDEEAWNVRRGRVRKAPTWMDDYVSSEGLSKKENEANMALMVTSDPLSFDEAVKISKWRLAMDVKIKEIKKNQT